MASASILLPNAPNFSGDNYDFWASKMRRFLMASDLWDIVDKGFEAPVENAQLTEEQQNISKENSSKDAKVLFILQSAVSDKIFPSIKNATTAKEAWTNLQKEHGGTINTDWMERMRAMQYNSAEKSKISFKRTVPKDLRKGKEKFYEPKFVSIGPVFRGSGRVLSEVLKWQSVENLLDRSEWNAEKLAECGDMINGLKQDVVAWYGEGVKQMKWSDITDILLYDACFILETLIMVEPIGRMEWVILNELEQDMLRDLLVLDNQIPLVIVRKLWSLLFPNRSDGFVEKLALENLFGYDLGPDKSLCEATTKASHFVELIHSYISIDMEMEDSYCGVFINNLDTTKNNNKKAVQLDRCATRLRAAGVKFNIRDRGIFEFRIRFDSSTGTLDVSSLYISEATETWWRNLIAWEDCKKGTPDFRCICTSWALFYNALICCESDVQLLRNSGIIHWDHDSGLTNKDVVNFFRSLVDGDKFDCHHYFDFAALNKYYRHKVNHITEIPTVLWHYLAGRPREAVRDLHNFLKRGYNYAAALITILSLLQTVYAVLSYHHPKKN